MWKLWHRFDVEISTWIPLSKSTKYWWDLHVDFSTLLWCGINITAALLTVPFYHFLTFSVLRNYSKLVSYSAESMKFQQYWHNDCFWSYWNCILWKFYNNADNYEQIIFIFIKIRVTKIIMPIFTNKNNIYLLQNNTNKVSTANIYMYKQFHISFKIILNNTLLVFKYKAYIVIN